MKLTIPERIELVELIGEKMPTSSFAGMQEIRRLTAGLGFTQEEVDEYAVRVDENSMKWDLSKAAGYVVDVPMGEWITNKIRSILVEMDHNEELTEGLSTLYEKIVIDYSVL